MLLASACALALLVPNAAGAKSNKPDLVISKVTIGSSKVTVGNKLKVGDTTKNRGSKSAGLSYTSFFVSKDKKLSYDDYELTSLTRFPDYPDYHKIKSLKAHKSAKGTKRLKIPTYIEQAGKYRVIACADILHHVTESTEANQCKASGKRVQIVIPPPDPPSLDSFDNPNNDTTPDVTGTAASGSTIRIYESDDCTGAIAGTGTASGGTFSINVTVPANATTDLTATATKNGQTSDCSDSVADEVDTVKPVVTLTDTTPASPNNDTVPTVNGSVTDAHHTSISVFTTQDCTGSVNGTGDADAGSPSDFTVPVGVTPHTTTMFSARATDDAGNVSDCSNSISYTTP